MAEAAGTVTAGAASSTATQDAGGGTGAGVAKAAAAAPIELPRSGTPEYAAWRLTGTLPEREVKTEGADSSAADTSKGTEAEDGARSAATQQQEGKHRKRDAETRIKELNARTRELERELAEANRLKDGKTAESSTAKPQPQAADAQATDTQATRPKPTLQDVGADGKPKYATHEDYYEDLTDWKLEQKLAARDREQQANQQLQRVNKEIREARERYEDFEDVTKPLIDEMLKPDIPREVFAVLNDSPVLADLLYTIGGTEASKKDFLDACRKNPTRAIRVALLIEQEIVKELGESGGVEKKPAGEEHEPPAKRSPGGAPAPPLEVGARGAGPVDDTERAVSQIMGGNPRAFRDYMRAENAKELRRRRGA